MYIIVGLHEHFSAFHVFHRYHILTEIMHATVIEDLKKTRGELEGEKGRTKGNKKGDLLQGRNLKRYINQVTTNPFHTHHLIWALYTNKIWIDSNQLKLEIDHNCLLKRDRSCVSFQVEIDSNQ